MSLEGIGESLERGDLKFALWIIFRTEYFFPCWSQNFNTTAKKDRKSAPLQIKAWLFTQLFAAFWGLKLWQMIKAKFINTCGFIFSQYFK